MKIIHLPDFSESNLRLLATANFPRWKRLLWQLMRRPVLRPVKHPERFEWVDDDQMDWN